MKVIIINGSPRTTGSTATLLHEIEDRLRCKDVDVEYFDLSRLSMSQCEGCCACYTTGHCHINDDAERLSDLIKEADGLVLGSPTYASNVSGYMKLLIDRGHFVIEQMLTGKHCLTVTTGENYGKKDAEKVLKKLVLYSGGHLVKSISMNASFNSITFSKSGPYHDITGKAADSLYTSILENRRSALQHLKHKVILSFGIKPFVRKKGRKYQGVIDKWKELGIYG